MFNEDLFQEYVKDCLGDAIDGEDDKVTAVEFAVEKMEELINTEADYLLENLTDEIENPICYSPIRR